VGWPVGAFQVLTGGVASGPFSSVDLWGGQWALFMNVFTPVSNL